MAFIANQFREVIRCTLEDFDLKILSRSAVELLMLTAAQESHLGTYLYQDDGDDDIETNLALGPFQIEPTTYYDVVHRIIVPRHPSFQIYHPAELITNIRLGIIVARFKYWQFPEPLPAATDIKSLARYYKRYYNTFLGAATVPQAVKNYKKYAL